MDFRFELSQPLLKGVQVVRVDPVGPSMHEVDFWRLHEEGTVAAVKAWYKQGEAPRWVRRWKACSTVTR